MKSYLQYWKLSQAEFELEQNCNIFHSASEQFKRNIEKGDFLWIVTADGQSLFLLAGFSIEEKLTDEQARTIYGDDIYEASCHVFGNEKLRYPIVKIDITDKVEGIRFVSPTGRDRLDFNNPKGWPGQLQTVRLLTNETHEIFKVLMQEHCPDWCQPLNEPDLPANLESEITSRKVGQGYGSDQDIITEVEAAAIKATTKRFEAEGWQVTSVENENLGFDLLCNRSSEELHLEVKGLKGEQLSIILTANELKRAQQDSLFVLVVVSRALESPIINVFNQGELGEFFTIEATQFRLSPKK